MRRLSFRPTAVALAVAAGALALAACSDTIVSPPTRGFTARPSFSVTPGTNSVTLASDGSTQHCTAQDVVGDWTVPATFGPFAGCGTALDLMPALAVYNPGWSAPISGSDWIGFTSNGGPSSDYRPETGRYVFQETFNIPAGATAPSLTLNSLSDNLVAVYLNGTKVSAQAVTDCNAGPPCNWNTANTFTATDATAADFHIGASNTVTIILVATPIGFGSLTPGIGGPAPTYGCYRDPQATGQAGFSGPSNVPTSPAHVFATRTKTVAANGTGCENPAGLDFRGTVSWTPAPPPPPLCDFITFGRLVTAVGDDKIVISGNAGGNAPGGGILGTIEISVGGTQYHVPTIESYGPTTSGVLFPDPFARVITGHSDTHLIELRLRDDPNPGQGEPGTAEGDKVWLKIDNTVVVPLQTLDKGNIQLHLHCRGPGE